MTIQLPLPETPTTLTSINKYYISVLYMVWDYAADKTKVGLLSNNQVKQLDDKVLVTTSKFGIYQAIFLKEDVANIDEVESTETIISKSEQEAAKNSSTSPASENPAEQNTTVQPKAPTNISLNITQISENTQLATSVATISATDPDSTAAQLSFSLNSTSDYPDNAKFSISGNQLSVEENIDYEAATSLTIGITVTDESNLTYSKSFNLNVVDVQYENFTVASGQWTWVSGSDTIAGQAASWGTKATADETNMPSARYNAASWIDANNNLWLFGGFGIDNSDTSGRLNDLWKFDGNNWTWISGSNSANQQGMYGTKGATLGSNLPGGRDGASTWIDNEGNLWLFGGQGYDAAGNLGYLNDLWKFDGTNWTWISGDNTRNQGGSYGVKGTAGSSNKPGGRTEASHAIDADGNFWLFGGDGYDSADAQGVLNDLWKFDGTNWTWIHGGNLESQAAVYGSKGTGDSANIPGSRLKSTMGFDSNGNLWVFGGNAKDSNGMWGEMNDLWVYDGSNWIWVSGDKTRNQGGSYGVKGTAGSSNKPGGRVESNLWIDENDNVWVYGGWGKGSGGSGTLNDLWMFNGTEWSWVLGSDSVDQPGAFGTKGSAHSDNSPPSRQQSAQWVDRYGGVYILGGSGFDSTGASNKIDDLWIFGP